MSLTLEVTDDLTSEKQPVSVDSDMDKSREKNGTELNLNCNNSQNKPDDQQKCQSSANSFWNPGHFPVDEDYTSYGSCANLPSTIDKSKMNQDEADQINKTFLNGGSNKINKDVESLCTGQSYYNRMDRCDTKIRWWRHPKFKENLKIFLAAFGLLIVGIGLIAMGIVVSVLPDIDFQSYVFFIAGAICFIPGAYHVVYLYFAVTGRKGYDFHQLPLFN